jgi:uncharacterized protein
MHQAPVGPAQDRIDLIDALRGIALLGILLANVLIFSGWDFLTEQGRVVLAGPDWALWQHRFHLFLVDGKFYTVFSLLFGAGFALQLDRLSKRGADGLAIYRRRILILLLFGLIHSCLIWDGDILTLYALMGLVLPFFYRLSDRALLGLSAAFIFVAPVAGMALFRLLGWAPDAGLMGLSDRIAIALGAIDPKDGVGWLRRDDFDGWFSFVASGSIFSWGIRIMSWRIPKVLGIMLLGIWVGRRLANNSLFDDRRLLWRVLIVGSVIGLPASLAYASLPDASQRSWPSLIGTVPLGLAYAAAFALAWPHAQRVLGIFSAAGRMALTNYLTQSAVCILVFYGIALGQIGRWPPGGFYAFALALYAAQVLFSRWWLSTHKQGPMEKLWRHWTYRRAQAVTPSPAAL